MANEHQKLLKMIHRLTGVFLEDEKVYLLESRLTELMKKNGITTWDQVADKLEAGKDVDFIEAVIDKITTHETRFFRDESIYDGLVMQMIPELLERKGVRIEQLYGRSMKAEEKSGHTMITGGTGGRLDYRLNIWSAACSTGQEPYSIAIMIKEKQPAIVPYVTILATDISKESLRRAMEGRYTKFEVDRGMPDYLLKKYFTRDGDHFVINDEIKQMVKFKSINLVAEPFPNMFDIIFCRNVIIYFAEDQKKQIFLNLQKALKPDGSLVLGSAESVAGYLDNFIIREFGLSRYYEIKASQVFLF